MTNGLFNGRKIGGRNLQKPQPAGNCVRCGHRIQLDEQYARKPGVLGKLCLPCADD